MKQTYSTSTTDINVMLSASLYEISELINFIKFHKDTSPEEYAGFNKFTISTLEYDLTQVQTQIQNQLNDMKVG
jgi:hypothetical protein